MSKEITKKIHSMDEKSLLRFIAEQIGLLLESKGVSEETIMEVLKFHEA